MRQHACFVFAWPTAVSSEWLGYCSLNRDRLHALCVCTDAELMLLLLLLLPPPPLRRPSRSSMVSSEPIKSLKSNSLLYLPLYDLHKPYNTLT